VAVTSVNGGYPLRRKISLFVLLAFVVTMTVINHGCARSGDLEENESFELDLNDPKLQERLGQDDGYAFAILYGADIHGSLETCG
jgi:hypothetical protein